MATTLDDIGFQFRKDGRNFHGYSDLYAGEWFTEDFPESWPSARAAHEWMTTHTKGADSDGVDLHWRIWDDASNQFIGYTHA